MQKFDLLKSKLAKASSILITTHAWPDADGIGGQIALCMSLKQLGKKAICVNELPLLERYKYLDPENVVFGMDEADDMDKVDLVIIVDTNTIKRVGRRMESYASDKELLYIDHHPCAEINPSEHIVDTTKAATGELVGDIILDLGVKFNKAMALALYTAIIIDTSSFRYPNVTSDTHKMISELMKAGVRPPEAYNGIYGTKKVKHMHILGQILQTADCNTREDVAWIVLDMEKITAQGTDVEDTHAFVNNLLILDNIKVACMFRDDGEDVKVSFRSTGNLDVGTVARMLGGGGHDHSAATIIPKSGRSLERVIKEAVQKIEVAVDSIQK